MSEYSTFWDNKELQSIKEAPIEKHCENLKLARLEGADLLEIAGGDPFLCDELLAFLKKAKSFGFYVKVKTNGLLYNDFAKKVAGLIDKLFFFLDYPMQNEHDECRGVESFNVVIDSIRYALSLKENPAIEFTLTRDSVRFLPEMIDLAEKLGVKVYLHTVYDGHSVYGFENNTYGYIKYFAKNKNVYMDLAEIDFAKNHGNKIVLPRCRAKEQTITFMPDGKRVSPCFFNQGGKQGKESVCYGCMRWPYMLPSFEIGFDRYRLFSWYSKWLNGQKEKKR